jgi:DNA-binding NarL/FixJ family response regulator
VVVADEPLFGRGLALLLRTSSDPFDAMSVESLVRARRLLSSGRPEVVLWCGDRLDTAMLERLADFRAPPPGPGLCLLANSADHVALRRFVSDSVRGIAVALRARRPELAQIRSLLDGVLLGESIIEPCVLKQILADPDVDNPLSGLTSAELEILGLVASGLRNYAIASRLDKSERAVEKQVSQIFHKLGLVNGRNRELDRRVSAARMFLLVE